MYHGNTHTQEGNEWSDGASQGTEFICRDEEWLTCQRSDCGDLGQVTAASRRPTWPCAFGLPQGIQSS